MHRLTAESKALQTIISDPIFGVSLATPLFGTGFWILNDFLIRGYAGGLSLVSICFIEGDVLHWHLPIIN